MTDLYPEDLEAATKREEYRKRLLEDIAHAERLTKAHRDAKRKMFKAIEAEEKRQAAARKKINNLRSAAGSIHNELAYVVNARDLLFAEFVDEDLRIEESRLGAILSKKKRATRKVQGELDELQSYLDIKDPKKIESTIRDVNGNPIRIDPNDPTSPRKRGMVRNPQHWSSKEERAEFMKSVNAAKLAVAEAEAAELIAQNNYNAAKSALDAAVEEAMRDESQETQA